MARKFILIFHILFILFSLICFKINGEEKYYVDVSIEQEFSTNSVCLLITHSVSMQVKDYTPRDFIEVSPDQVIDDDPYTYEYIVKYLNGEQIDTNKINIDQFRRGLTLKWNNDKTKEEIIEIIHILEQREDIYLVQPNYLYELQSNIPNDPNNNYLYGYQQMNIPSVWDYTTGQHSIKVGIIDSGIDGTHSDLTFNLNNSLHKDFCNTPEQPLVDNYGHGTAVAGLVGAKGNNSLGISGICWDVSLVSLKVYDVHNGVLDNFIPSSYVKSAIAYSNINDISILNFSAHLINSNNVPVNDMYLYTELSNYNGLFVCSAGNCAGAVTSSGYNDSDYNNDNHPVYPANYAASLDNVISVGGIDNLNKRSTHSHYGQNTVTLFACYDAYSTSIMTSGYNDFFGTSASSPIVAGAIALLHSIDTSISLSTIKNVLLNTCDLINIDCGLVFNNQIGVYPTSTYIGKKLNVYSAANYLMTSIVSGLNSHIIQNTSYNNFSENVILSNNNINYKNKQIYKLNVIDAATYQFRIDNSWDSTITIYDSNLNMLSTNNCNSIGQARVFKSLNVDTYYVKVETSYNYLDNINLQIERQFNVILNYNSINHFDNLDINDLNVRYINYQYSGYYNISLIPLDPLGYTLSEIPDYMLEIYSDDERTILLAYTTQSICTINIYLEYGVTYYFDIENNIGDLSGFNIWITN